jgi:hypothetical protein
MDKFGFDPAFDIEGLFDDDYLYFYAIRDPGGGSATRRPS